MKWEELLKWQTLNDVRTQRGHRYVSMGWVIAKPVVGISSPMAFAYLISVRIGQEEEVVLSPPFLPCLCLKGQCSSEVAAS